MSNTSGYLSIRVGPMRSGKTHWLHSLATRYADIGEKVLYINSMLDDSELRKLVGGDGVNYTSHSSSNTYISSKVTNVKVLRLASVDIEGYDVICIDEAQFYDDLYHNVYNWLVNHNKHIYIVSLDGSYNQTLIGEISKLLPYSNQFEKLSAICMYCVAESNILTKHIHTPADYTILLCDSNIDSEINPGMTDSYHSVCLYHMLKHYNS